VVGHDPKSVPSVRRADAASRKIDRPDGVAVSFQVSENKVEPIEPVLARNLLTKDRDRSALADEAKPRRPKVARIVGTFACSRHAERLAGAASGPALSLGGPAGEAEGVSPAADPGEEMALSEPSEIVWGNIGN
jgi:hypothetical protein